ncbi:MAG TPA: CRTAC1 family protein [Candidatus Acidoferrales bacterium]|nr:CRTAC1 family protein [Candidatus Acidoferrales bacterium]
MKITRRTLLISLPFGLSARKLLAQQGMASRHVKAQPKLPPSGKPFNAHFVDVAREAGLASPVIYGSATQDDYIIESDGCGCAFVDYDNDGWMDIFLLTGTRIGGAPPGTTNRLYHNNRDGTFTDVTLKAGLHRLGWASSVCVGDYDNDGFEDLFCTYWGQNILYHNNGDGTFTDVTKRARLWNDGPVRWGAGCTFIDYDRNGHLDLFVSNYLKFDFAHVPKPGQDVNCNWRGVPVECGPRGLPFARQYLYRNNGDGTFTDVSDASGIAKPRGNYGMTAVCTDFDEDGWPDIFVACDSTPSLLFMNNHDGTFREEGILRGVALNEDGMEQAGMGVGIGDYNLRGHLDLYLTHFSDDTNTLYRNNGKGFFDDVTTDAHLGVDTRFTCWGAGIVDLDNDGFPDIFAVAGSVYPELERKLPQYPNECPREVYRNLGNGTFEELAAKAGPAIVEAHSSRGCAFGDFDNDGDVDILVVNLNEPPSLLRNDVSGSNHWLKVKLVGTKSNRSAIGARVLVRYGKRVQAQAVVSQSSYYSASDPRLHFGLGAETRADIEIHWPSGHLETLKAVHSNQLVTIVEGAGIIPSKGWLAAERK